jgi:small subunit ribosomal protein S5
MSDEVKNTEEIKDASMTASPSDIAPAAEVDIMVRGSLGGDNAAPDARGGRGGRSGGPGGRGGAGGRGGRGRDDRGGREREKSEFNQVTLDLARVTRVTKGGKRMRFRATVVIGDGKGRVGFGTSKGVDVQASVLKATNQAKKHLITIPMERETIPHRVHAKAGAAQVIIMPAPQGSGIIAGGPVRVVLQLAGVPNAAAKILGANNKINNVRATMEALKMLKAVRVRTPKEKAE